MARNRVQFQKGLSMARFNELYGTEEQCHEALVNMRWPEDFECPDCGGRSAASTAICARGASFNARAATCKPLPRRALCFTNQRRR